MFQFNLRFRSSHKKTLYTHQLQRYVCNLNFDVCCGLIFVDIRADQRGPGSTASISVNNELFNKMQLPFNRKYHQEFQVQFVFLYLS